MERQIVAQIENLRYDLKKPSSYRDDGGGVKMRPGPVLCCCLADFVGVSFAPTSCLKEVLIYG
jgi:hypothetical protein